MAGPNVTSASPANNATGVVLGQPITVVFDSLIDHSTLTTATFSVTYPSGAEVLTPDAYIAKSPKTLTATAYVDGALTITDSDTATTLTFTPSLPLKTNTQYTVFLLGGDAQFSAASVKDTNGNPLAVSYQWTFTTGSLNLPSPPVSSPLPPVRGAVLIPLDPGSVRIDPRVQSTNNNLTRCSAPAKSKEVTRGRGGPLQICHWRFSEAIPTEPESPGRQDRQGRIERKIFLIFFRRPS
jgi:hypothetical protein